MKDLFLQKESVHHQHWTSDGKRYNVGMLYDYARSVAGPQDIPLSALKRGFEGTDLDEEKWSDEFVERCQQANLDYPILVVQDDKQRFWIADGNHRYGKAVIRGDEFVSGYIVRELDLPEEAIEPELKSRED
jgi:hypothetical protein